MFLFGKNLGTLVFCVWFCTVTLSFGQARFEVSAESVIDKAVERASARSHGASPAYTYTKLNVTEQFDTRGKVKVRKARRFQVYFRSGASYVKLLEVDGHAPARADVQFQSETQSSIHQFLGQSASGGDNRENFLTPELAAHFEYTLLGQISFNGRATYQVQFQPKNGGPPISSLLDRVLNHLSGTLWIDAEEFEIARADIQLGSEVDFLGGVIGCLRKLAYSMTRTRVADGVWLHSSSYGDFEGRKLLEPMRVRMQSECSNFQLLTSTR